MTKIPNTKRGSSISQGLFHLFDSLYKYTIINPLFKETVKTVFIISFWLAHDISRGLLNIFNIFNHFNGLTKDSIKYKSGY